MNSKIEIVLDKVDDICEKFEMEGLHSHPTYKQFKRLFAELNAVTAASVGERQPVDQCDLIGDQFVCTRPRGHVGRCLMLERHVFGSTARQEKEDSKAFDNFWYARKSTAIGSSEAKWCFDAGVAHGRSSAPPELAELQATIARLTAENERLNMVNSGQFKAIDRIHCMYGKRLLELTGEAQTVLIPDEEFVKYFEEIKALKAEIERLKGGQGEPVAWGYCPECGCEDLHHEHGEHKQCANCYQEWFSDIDYAEVVRGNFAKLKASQPAPVSVALPEREHDKAYRNGLMQGYNFAINGSEQEYQDAVARYSKHDE